MSLKVKVTRELIDYADSRDPGNCAIAMAIRAAHPDFACVRVERQEMTGNVLIKYSDRRTGERICYKAPQFVKDEWLPVFDTDKDMARDVEFTATSLEWVKPMKRTHPLAKREPAAVREDSGRRLRPLPK